MKRRHLFLVLILVCVSLIPFWIVKILAQEETSTTFPVNEAGIAAYTKVSSISPQDLLQVGDELVKTGESFIIVRVNVLANEENLRIPVNVYIGLDGWIVAYLSRGEPTAKIMQWKNYKGRIENNVLKDAIEIVCNQMNKAYSQPIKYYHFEFPQATKLTLITERTSKIEIEGGYQSAYQNDFYLTTPQVPYEVSFELARIKRITPCFSSYSGDCPMSLRINNNLIVSGVKNFAADRLNVNLYFQPNISTHFVCEGWDTNCCFTGTAIAIVY
jgi:hypothetical protein